jgi:hypothetical protein
MASHVFEDLGYRRYERWIDLVTLATLGRSGTCAEVFASTIVSLFRRGGFRSQRQRAQRVDCV